MLCGIPLGFLGGSSVKNLPAMPETQETWVMFKTVANKKAQNNAICSNMDGPRDYDTE